MVAGSIIAWRAKLDLDLLDVTSDDEVRWLSCLVWPDEGDRAERLAAAVAAASRDPPAVHHGDLPLQSVGPGRPGAARRSPGHLPHPVLHQVTPGQREQFARPVRGLGAA